MKPVRLSASAVRDISAICNDIAADKPTAAASFVDHLIQRFHSLASAPEGYGLTPSYGPGVRGVTVPPHIVLYRIRERDILMFGVRHGARKPVAFT